MSKTSQAVSTASVNKSILSWSVLKKVVKTGIIQSNVFTTFVGAYLAVYVYHQGFLEHLPFILLTLIGAAFVIGGAGAVNNYYDRDIDRLMERTQDRPTVDGSINPTIALWLGIALTIIGSIMLFSVSMTAGIMGLLGFVFYVFAYTMLTKRKTIWNTEVGCISGAIPPLIGWGAMSPHLLNPIAIGMFLLMFFWQPPHFYSIATRRFEDYREAGVPMLPVVKGMKRTKIQTLVYLVPLFGSTLLFIHFSLAFVIISALLTVVWAVLGLKGFGKMDDKKWATMMFVYSLNYLMIVFSLMVIVTFFM
ncbi:heme o synthase [Pullulanibacillus sp. KACC 23026]|uniref:heme o synthase n=1 Tax=Pullulanibacillus sp. KACC 23026 TaxID=3028315 RepID=UPI0023AF0765|nr:heme o synthase [Pullulanibacillus sp. KACC 23026]WEG14666.1 heme o synthase [Pullulanibacillus sp. KACC 23026]